MGDLLSCDAVDMQDTVSRYVSGHLTEEEAAALRAAPGRLRAVLGEKCSWRCRCARRPARPRRHLTPQPSAPCGAPVTLARGSRSQLSCSRSAAGGSSITATANRNDARRRRALRLRQPDCRREAFV